MPGTWSRTDRDAFVAQLRGEGIDAETIARWSPHVDRVLAAAGGVRVLPKHVEDALRQTESYGASAAELADLQRLGEKMVRFARDLPEKGAFALGAPSEETAALELVRVTRATGAAARVSRPPAALRPGKRPPPVRGRCAECGGVLRLRGERPPTILMTGGGAVGAIATFAALELLGTAGVVAAVGGAIVCTLFVSAVFARWACARCGSPGALVTSEQRRELAKLRAWYALAALGAAALAAVVVVAAGGMPR